MSSARTACPAGSRMAVTRIADAPRNPTGQRRLVAVSGEYRIPADDLLVQTCIFPPISGENHGRHAEGGVEEAVNVRHQDILLLRVTLAPGIWWQRRGVGEEIVGIELLSMRHAPGDSRQERHPDGGFCRFGFHDFRVFRHSPSITPSALTACPSAGRWKRERCSRVHPPGRSFCALKQPAKSEHE